MKKNSDYNNAVAKALKNVPENQWVHMSTFTTMHECLTGINLYSWKNSGWYEPIAIKLNGIKGFFIVNQDGTIFSEARIIKEADDKFRIEEMSIEAWNQFENDLRSFLGE
jgi:hypothetical protein